MLHTAPSQHSFRRCPAAKTELTVAIQHSGMNRADAVTSELATLKPELESEFPIRKLGVFGSYARGEQHSDSDLDILVEFAEPVTLFELVRLENELTTRLGVDVDLVTRNSLKPGIKARVSDDVVYV